MLSSMATMLCLENSSGAICTKSEILVWKTGLGEPLCPFWPPHLELVPMRYRGHGMLTRINMLGATDEI